MDCTYSVPSGHAEVNQLSLLTIEFDEVEGHEGWLLDYWFVITEVWDLVPFLFYFSRFTLAFVFDPGVDPMGSYSPLERRSQGSRVVIHTFDVERRSTHACNNPVRYNDGILASHF